MSTHNNDCHIRGPLKKGAVYYTSCSEQPLRNIILIENVTEEERKLHCISRRNTLSKDQKVITMDRAMLEDLVAQTADDTENMRIIDCIAAEYRVGKKIIGAPPVMVE